MTTKSIAMRSADDEDTELSIGHVKGGGMEADDAEVFLDVDERGGISVGRGGSLWIRAMVSSVGGPLRRNSKCFCDSGKKYKH